MGVQSRPQGGQGRCDDDDGLILHSLLRFQRALLAIVSACANQQIKPGLSVCA